MDRKGASVFKTLNTTGFGNMADPVFHGVKSVMSRLLRPNNQTLKSG